MATNIRHQLKDLCTRNSVSLTTAGSDYDEQVRRALLSGLFLNVAEHTSGGKYQTVSQKYNGLLSCVLMKYCNSIFLHYGNQSRLIVFHLLMS